MKPPYIVLFLCLTFLHGCTGSYDKCIIDELEGQSHDSVFYFVQSYCEKLFPFEKKLFLNYKDVGFSFEVKSQEASGLPAATGDSFIYVIVASPPKEYNITKITMTLIDQCTNEEPIHQVKVEVDTLKPLFSNKNGKLYDDQEAISLQGWRIVEASGKHYNCARNIEFFGKLINRFDIRQYMYF